MMKSWQDCQITAQQLFDCPGSSILNRTNSYIPLININYNVVNEILHDSAKMQKVSRDVASSLSHGMGPFMASWI